jgi:hypothetical protein
MALCGGHYAPAALPAADDRRTGVAAAVPPSSDESLRGWDPTIEPDAKARGTLVPPFVRARAQRRRCLYRSSIRYGDHPAQLLDVWRLPELSSEPAPVLLFVPGGAWVHHQAGRKHDACSEQPVPGGWPRLVVSTASTCFTNCWLVSKSVMFPNATRIMYSASVPIALQRGIECIDVTSLRLAIPPTR